MGVLMEAHHKKHLASYFNFKIDTTYICKLLSFVEKYRLSHITGDQLIFMVIAQIFNNLSCIDIALAILCFAGHRLSLKQKMLKEPITAC